ncbi:DUF4169 family protein [Blastochloris viridis]|nr:DUF4169 family protein [Blastochloris viridis]
MVEVINLRRARKKKARIEADAIASSNRLRHAGRRTRVNGGFGVAEGLIR